MKIISLFLVFYLCFLSEIYSQEIFSGVWQGIIYKEGQKINESNIFFLNLASNETNVTGKSREEIDNSDNFVVQKIKGVILDSISFKFKQYVIETKKKDVRYTWHPFEATMKYNDSTGYFTGEYLPLTGRKLKGKIILYRSKSEFSSTEQIMLHQSWKDIFVKDLLKNKKAPELREKDRENFAFHPIYFDYDKDEVKKEYHAYLVSMVDVILDHTDLRIKITGHTDADGSDAYNKELSERRAKAIQDFFVKNGLPPHKLVIDFKGESHPIDNNRTDEGKQKNRRVDFEFI